ncbi:MAG: ABC transporter substrate-binding protein [Gemmatimonadota bacterium]
MTMVCVAIGGATAMVSCSPGDRESIGAERSGGVPTLSGDSRPRVRVVSLMPAATEILFAIGAGDRLVGRTRWGVHPPRAADVPSVGDGVRPSLEAVLAVRPDLVVLFEGSDTQGVADRLRALGIATVALRHNTLHDLERNVMALGEAVGCVEAAAELNERIRGDLRAVADAVRPTTRVRVYYDVWADPPITVGQGSFLDSLLTLAGAENVFGDLGPAAPQVGLETIVQRDPDVIVHPVTSLPGGVGPPPDERPRWKLIPAVAEGRVLTVDADLLGRLGPRIGQAAGTLASALWPGIEMPEAASGPLEAECSP